MGVSSSRVSIRSHRTRRESSPEVIATNFVRKFTPTGRVRNLKREVTRAADEAMHGGHHLVATSEARVKRAMEVAMEDVMLDVDGTVHTWRSKTNEEIESMNGNVAAIGKAWFHKYSQEKDCL